MSEMRKVHQINLNDEEFLALSAIFSQWTAAEFVLNEIVDDELGARLFNTQAAILELKFGGTKTAAFKKAWDGVCNQLQPRRDA